MQRQNGVFQGKSGRVIAGGVVRVFQAGTQVPALIYTDPAGTQPIADLLTNIEGEFSFYVANGRYDIRVYVGGQFDNEILDVLAFDPADLANDVDLSGVEAQISEVDTRLSGTVSALSAQVQTLVTNGLDAARDVLPDDVGATDRLWGIWANNDTAPISSLADEVGAAMIGTASGVTLQSALDTLSTVGAGADKQSLSEKDASGGYVGLSGFNIKLKNSTGTVTTELATLATGGQTYTFPNKSGTVAMTSDLSGGYTLPAASASVLGGVKVGSGLAIDGAGILSSTASGTGAMVLLGSATVGAEVANIDFLNVFTSAYDKYVIEIHGASPSTQQILNLRIATGGVVDTNISSYYVMAAPGAGIASASQLALSSTPISDSYSATVEVSSANSTTRYKHVFVRGYGGGYSVFAAGAYLQNVAASGFRLYWPGGANFIAGTVRVYGIKNA